MDESEGRRNKGPNGRKKQMDEGNGPTAEQTIERTKDEPRTIDEQTDERTNGQANLQSRNGGTEERKMEERRNGGTEERRNGGTEERSNEAT